MSEYPQMFGFALIENNDQGIGQMIQEIALPGLFIPNGVSVALLQSVL